MLRRMLLALLLNVSNACTRVEPPPPMPLGPSLIASEEPLHSLRATAADDSLGLSTPQDLAATPSGMVVVDHGNDRLVMLTQELRPERTISRSGSGPGELQLPMYVEPHAGGLAVGDLTNRRIAFFDSTGQHVSTRRLPVVVRHFAIAPDGDAFMAARMRDHYVLRLHPGGNAAALAPRALELYPRSDRRGRGAPFGAGADLIVRTPDGQLHVFDNRIGAMLRFDTAGQRTLARSLPADLAAELAAHRNRRIEALRRAGHEVVSAPLAKDLTVTDGGQLLLLFAAARAFGLLIDPDTYRARRLELPASEGARPLWSATAGVVVADRITVISHADVFTFRLNGHGVASR